MTWDERNEIKKERNQRINTMSDAEKLDYIVRILKKDIDMFTDCSDTHGVDFTKEYYEQQDEIEDFLEAIEKNK